MSEKIVARDRLQEAYDGMYEQANNAVNSNSLDTAMRTCRIANGLFQSKTAAERTKELNKAADDLDENNKNKVNTFKDWRSWARFSGDIVSAAVQIGGGLCGLGVLGQGAAAASQSISYAGQGIKTGFDTTNSGTQATQTSLDGQRDALKTHQEDVRGKRDSAKQNANRASEDQKAADQARQAAFRTAAGA